MALINQLQIEIRYTKSYTAQKNEKLNGKPCFSITCNYDDQLVGEIKDTIPWQQREWTGKVWVILKDDPNQQPDQEKNLAFVRRICKECADRRGWLLADYTAASEEAIEQSKQQSEAELLEAHIVAVCAVLPKLPPYSLRLTRWRNTLSLQLTRYLGENEAGYELFMELFKACANAYKNRMLASFDRKMSAGYVFEVAADVRIIRALMQCKGIEYLKVFELAPTQTFEDETTHLVDANGVVFLGINHTQVDMSELDFDSKSWQVSLLGEEIYWVAERDKYIEGWLEQDSHSVVGFGGAFGHFIQQKSKLPELLELFHLEEWFRDWAIEKLSTQEIELGRYAIDGWNASSWQHPADKLLTHLHKFTGSSYGGEKLQEIIGAEFIQERRSEIQSLKEQAAKDARAEARANAKSLAAVKLRSSCKSKADLTTFAQKQGIEIKKSWTIDRILEAITSDQDRCETIIKLPREPQN